MDRKIKGPGRDHERELHRVGRIEPRIADVLGIPVAACDVWLHAKTVAHIIARRAAAEAEFTLQYLPLTIRRPELVGIETRDSRRLRFVKFVTAERRHLQVSLKLVQGEGLDEQVATIWVSSAFPLGGKSLTRLLRRENLHVVDWEAGR